MTPSEPLDLNRFRVPATPATPTQSKRLPRHRKGEWFLKGPIPGEWLHLAAKLGGKALHVALAAWHEGELKKSRAVRLSRGKLLLFGVKPAAARRGLEALKEAGLIVVEQRRGCSPLVTIVEETPAETCTILPSDSATNERAVPNVRQP